MRKQILQVAQMDDGKHLMKQKKYKESRSFECSEKSEEKSSLRAYLHGDKLSLVGVVTSPRAIVYRAFI